MIKRMSNTSIFVKFAHKNISTYFLRLYPLKFQKEHSSFGDERNVH